MKATIRRTYILLMLVLAMPALWMTTGCDSSSPEPPTPPDEPIHRLFNEQDSAIMTRLVHQELGVPTDSMQGKTYIEIHLWLLEKQLQGEYIGDIVPEVTWTFHEDLLQFRVTGLMLSSYYDGDNPGVLVPDYLGGLDSLHNFELQYNFGGELPEYFSEYPRLTEIVIYGTKLRRLPDGLFNKNTEWLYIVENDMLTRVPSSVSELDNYDKPERRFQIWANRNMGGECPAITNAMVNLSENSYTSIDWAGVGRKYLGSDGEVWYTGAYLNSNRLSAPIPEEILRDTVALCNFADLQFGHQQDGIRPSNMPTDRQIKKMREEYIRNHPEDVVFATSPGRKPGEPDWNEESRKLRPLTRCNILRIKDGKQPR